MPFFDGTGPRWGGGPGAGWRMGNCGYNRGRGRRFWGYPGYPSKKEEKETLENELETIKERLAELK